MFHYLDDFLCLGSPGTEECSLALATLLGSCEELHLPLAIEKQKGLASCIEFLGIELDSATMQLRLPVQTLNQPLKVGQAGKHAQKENFSPWLGWDI